MVLPDLDDIGAKWKSVAAADEAFDKGDYSTAIRLFEALTNAGSTFAYASYRAGLAHARLGQRAEAEDRLRRAADLGHPLAMVEIAKLVAPDRADEAAALLLRAVDHGYRDGEALMREPLLRDIVTRSQTDLSERMQPARHDENRRQFDFWLGEWDVRAADGRPAGRNTIRSLLSGAVIHEDWQSAAGWRGQSVNFYNDELGSWEQLWVQDDGSQTHYTDGHFTEGALRFATSTRDGPRRLSFYPLPNGWVRQVGETQAIGEWIVEYDLIYTPRADRPSAP